MMNLKCWVVLMLVWVAACEILTLDKSVLNQIYQENKIFVIYVHGNSHNFQVQSVFNAYCFGDKSCAILQPNNPEYYNLLQFIGYTDPEYFLIIDAATKRKYIQPITSQSITTNDLLTFQYKFLFKELQPFFSSEPLPNEINLSCAKLVGKNLGAFLRRSERVKVILLYNLNDNCPTCDSILQLYMPFAEQNYKEGQLTFGYFNTFLNDHPIIQDEKTPSFVVFVDEQYQTPFSLEANSLENLSYFLQKMIGSQFSNQKQRQEQQVEEQTTKEQNEL